MSQAEAARQFRWVGSRPVRPDGVDKVTGRAAFGADMALPGMLVGKVLRSPHAHARIGAIDLARARAHPGVKAVVTSADLPDIGPEAAFVGEDNNNYHHLSRNVLARDKVLYEGHDAVAAVAATSPAAAAAALALIDVDYEILPHVIDVRQAIRPDAPLLYDDLLTKGVEPAPETPSNIAQRYDLGHGDVEAGFAAADVVVERAYTTRPVHQGYIEPHAVVASTSENGQSMVWCSSQGHFMVRACCAMLLGIDISDIRVIPAEIGGGFGGKTTVYLEPLALLLSRRTGRPVKLVMTRAEVFQGTGPTSGTASEVRIGATRDGRITAAEAVLWFGAGAFPGSHVQFGAMCAFAPYDLENVKVVGYDVVVNRQRCAPYRAPGAPMAGFAVESCLDELAKGLAMDPLELRALNAAGKGTKAAYGPRYGPVGYAETVEAARRHPHYTAVQDAGRAIHPGYVEGKMQGGVAQGIGWALNEEYVYDANGRMRNPGFLDYRVPLASDLPMIETVIVEVPNPRHPFGVRGVGEVPIIPPLAAVANAIENAVGVRLTDLPMSPPRVLAAIGDAA